VEGKNSSSKTGTDPIDLTCRGSEGRRSGGGGGGETGGGEEVHLHL